MSVSSFAAPPVFRATARHRIILGYAAAPDRIAPLLPAGLVPETEATNAYVCLVGTVLVEGRVLGLSGIVRHMPVVELRVPVRKDSPDGTRGTWTVQAYVPRRPVAWTAQFLYGEPVAATSMQPMWTERNDRVVATYRFDRAGREQRLRVVGGSTPDRPPQSDVPSVLLGDRAWRYGTFRTGTLLRTPVAHSFETLYRVREHHVTVRWGSVYGDEWAFLADREPALVHFAPGGSMEVGWPERVE